MAADLAMSLRPLLRMPLLNLPDELLMMIGESLSAEKDIYSLSRSNSRLHSIGLPILYKHNVQHSRGSSFAWCINHGNETGVNLLLRWGLHLSNSRIRLPIGISSPDASANPQYGAARWGGCVDQDFGGPLHIPLHPETIRLLVCHGADVNELSDTGKTPLHEAVRFGNLPVVQVLLDLGADVNAAGHEPHRWFEFQSTPLHCALRNKVHKSYLEIVNLLIKSGADLAKTDARGDSPLHAVAGHGFVRPSMYLTDTSAAVQLSSTKMNLTEVSFAQSLSRTGSWKSGNVSDEILESIECSLDKCSLRHYTTNTLLDTANLLLSYGAATNIQNIYGLTPLQTALRQGNLLVAKLLLKHGDDARTHDDKVWP